MLQQLIVLPVPMYTIQIKSTNLQKEKTIQGLPRHKNQLVVGIGDQRKTGQPIIQSVKDVFQGNCLTAFQESLTRASESWKKTQRLSSKFLSTEQDKSHPVECEKCQAASPTQKMSRQQVDGRLSKKLCVRTAEEMFQNQYYEACLECLQRGKETEKLRKPEMIKSYRKKISRILHECEQEKQKQEEEDMREYLKRMEEQKIKEAEQEKIKLKEMQRCLDPKDKVKNQQKLQEIAYEHLTALQKKETNYLAQKEEKNYARTAEESNAKEAERKEVEKKAAKIQAVSDHIRFWMKENENRRQEEHESKMAQYMALKETDRLFWEESKRKAQEARNEAIRIQNFNLAKAEELAHHRRLQRRE